MSCLGTTARWQALALWRRDRWAKEGAGAGRTAASQRRQKKGRRKMTLRSSLTGLFAVGLLGLAGCSGDAGSDAEADGPVASVTQAITCNPAIYNSCSEWAGDSITIRTYQCKVTGPRGDFLLEKPHTVAVCPVEPGFVVVGG